VDDQTSKFLEMNEQVPRTSSRETDTSGTGCSVDKVGRSALGVGSPNVSDETLSVGIRTRPEDSHALGLCVLREDLGLALSRFKKKRDGGLQIAGRRRRRIALARILVLC
jgi:hypothetical protein